MKKGMEESYIEDLANRDGPDHVLATREGAAKRWFWGARRPAIEPRNRQSWAAWCGPCRMISPVLEDLAKSHAGHLKIVKVDVDTNPGLASKFGAQSIPLLVVIRDGREIDRVVGALPRTALEQRLRPVLAA